LATYGFLCGSGGLFLKGDLSGFEGKDNRGGGRPHDGCVGRRGAEKEREATDATEGVGEVARLAWPARNGWRREGSTDFLPELLGTEFEVVEDRLIVRCREANVELKSREDDAIFGPDTDLLVDTTESRLEDRFGMSGAL
jgi:hypothetical protein